MMVGPIDVATNIIETPEEVADTLRRALRFGLGVACAVSPLGKPGGVWLRAAVTPIRLAV